MHSNKKIKKKIRKTKKKKKMKHKDKMYNILLLFSIKYLDTKQNIHG